MSGNSATGGSRQTATPKTEFKVVEPPVLGADPVKQPVADSEIAKIKKGEMVQFRDESGNVMYRKTEPIKGKTGTGKDLVFNMTVRASPVPMTKFKGVGDHGDKQVKKKWSTAGLPKYQFANGKLTPAASGPNNTGTTDGNTGK